MTNRQELRIAGRFIPKNSIEIKNDDGAVYVYRVGARYAAIAYRGTSEKSAFHYSYPNMEAVDVAVCNFFDNLKSHRERVSNYRAESYKPHTFKVGDIVTNSWGYDQTNVDWYKVIRTSKSFVWIQPIAAQTEETGFMSGTSAPSIDTTASDPNQWGFKVHGEITKHKASGSNVTMKYGCGSKWNGQTKYCSWYA